jgi:hypothetical protein
MLIALTNIQVQNQLREPTPRIPKLPDVEPFDGSKSKYSVFMAKIQNFFNAQNSVYDNDAKKISYVITRLEGIAADWATTVIENRQQEGNFKILNDWESYSIAFLRFSDPFARQNATVKLLNLSQGPSQSVLSYWTKFSELLYRSEISADSARPLFERGLKKELRERMADRDYPTVLNSFVDAVISLDNRIYRIRNETSRLKSNYGSERSKMPFSFGEASNGVVPMQIGQVGTTELTLPDYWKSVLWLRMSVEEFVRRSIVAFIANVS